MDDFKRLPKEKASSLDWNYKIR